MQLIIISIKKCDSPVGDGNERFSASTPNSKNIKKCDSPVGDGNMELEQILKHLLIKKCDSPVGDGNRRPVCSRVERAVSLRNVIPR